MWICGAGDIHGALDGMYAAILDFEQALGLTFDLVLHVGDFGAWPDPEKLDKATVKRDGPGDFARWLSQGKQAPRPTVFIPGNHEDFDYLSKFTSPREVLPGLTYLPSGGAYEFKCHQGRLRVGGVGGCFSPNDYEKPYARLAGKARRHFTKDQVERVIAKARDGRFDVIMTHDAPTGVLVPTRGDNKVASKAEGLGELIARTRPRLSLFGHHHVRVDGEVQGIRCIGLNCSPHAGSLVALDLPERSSEWAILGEWPA